MEWNRGPTIGRGSSGTVSIATSSTTSEVFAVKSAELPRSSFLQKEKEIISQLNSPYIIQYRGHQTTYENNTQFYNLLMEYVPGGSVSDSLRKNGGSIDESTIRIFTHQILSGLEYLHGNGIVHCDIKGQNLLIGKDTVKIADFGCAKGVTAKSEISGTPSYMAPEVARGEEQSFPADMWALGCTVIEMATGSHPFSDEESPVSVLYQVGVCNKRPEIPVTLSKQARDFLKKCLEIDPKLRWTVKELLQHPFFDNLRLNSPKCNEFIRVSPTSMLDQGFWDSIEVPNSSPNSVQYIPGPNSPLERMIRLINLSNSDILNWDIDEDWINVRVQEDEQNSESIEIESIFGSQVFDSFISDSLDFNDVSFYLDCFSLVSDTFILSENVSDDIFHVSSDLEIINEISTIPLCQLTALQSLLLASLLIVYHCVCAKYNV